MPAHPTTFESARAGATPHGDPAWSLLVALDEREVVRYLDDRAAKSHNSIIVDLIEHKFGGPGTRAGDLPSLRQCDFTTPNAAWFAFADRLLGLAAERGIRVLLAASLPRLRVRCERRKLVPRGARERRRTGRDLGARRLEGVRSARRGRLNARPRRLGA